MSEKREMPLLSVVGLTALVEGDDGQARVLDDLMLTLRAGEIVDVVGPSGCGKTTLLRAVARLLPNVTGELQLRGVSADQVEAHVWRTHVALLPQKPSMLDGTVRDNLCAAWRLKVRAGQTPPTGETLRAALDQLHLAEVSLDRQSDRLSLGQQARIALLRVVLAEPDVLLLDEPDASLDDASAAEVARATALFASRGGAVLRVRHQRTDAIATRRLALSDGRLAEVPA